jgi:hypothetical protein
MEKLVDNKTKLAGADIVDPDFDRAGDISGRAEKARKKLEKINAKIDFESNRQDFYNSILEQLEKTSKNLPDLSKGEKFKFYLKRFGEWTTKFAGKATKKAIIFIPGGVLLMVAWSGYEAVSLYLKISKYLSNTPANSDYVDIAVLTLATALSEAGVGDIADDFLRDYIKQGDAAARENRELPDGTMARYAYDTYQKNLKNRSAEDIEDLMQQTMDAARMSGEKGDLFNVNESKLSKLKLKIILG